MRRTRYTFRCEHISPTTSRIIEANGGTMDALAYSAEQAFALLERRGYYNIERVTRPARRAPAGGGFKIDRRALREARDFMGLRWPVRIREHSRYGSVNGNYRVGDDHSAPFHNIMVKSYLSPEQASRTIWHELRHAFQAEQAAQAKGARLAGECRRAFDGVIADDRGVSYRAKSIERDAREYEQYAEVVQIAVSR